MKEDYQYNKLRKVFRYLQNLKEGYTSSTYLCKNRKCQLTNDYEEIKTIWKTYFQSMPKIKANNQQNERKYPGDGKKKR